MKCNELGIFSTNEASAGFLHPVFVHVSRENKRKINKSNQNFRNLWDGFPV